MSNNFVHLHNHSHYSLLDSVAKVPEMVARAKELGQTHISLTDHGHMFGAAQFYNECNKQGVVPILGTEIYFAPEGIEDKSRVVWGQLEDNGKLRDVPGPYCHLTLLAQDATGLRNLYKLHERSYTEGQYYKNRVDLAMLKQHHEGLIVLSGCAGSPFSTRLRLGQKTEAYDLAEQFIGIFGDRFMIEIMFHNLPWEPELNAQLELLARDTSSLLIATNDVHMVHPGEAHVHDAFLCLQTGAQLADEQRFRFNGSGFHLRSAKEMYDLSLPRRAIDNTLVVAEMVEANAYDDVFKKRNLMPRWEGEKSLREVVEEKLRQDYPPEYRERADYELGIIEQMGYEDYFLVLSDIVSWSKNRGILIGPGRGSAGGSLVAYLLEITEIDPLRHGLIFERFLNPQRISVPDIDVDVQDDRRAEVIEYAVQRYGPDRVAQVITFGTIKAKAAIKDANRVMGGNYSQGEQLSGMVPDPIAGKDHPLAGLSKLRQANPEVYDLATGLEGLVRSTGKHAAGLVISPEPLVDVIPVKKDKEDPVITAAYDQGTLEAHGLVKYDFLGLKELRIIQKTLEIIDAG